ncbi:hypothetical protein ACWFPY_25140 [Nocardia fluminea]
MRVRDVVAIPHRLPVGRYPDRDQPGTPTWAWWWLCGTRFRLTVTEVDLTGPAPEVEGLRITEHAHIDVALTDD